MTIVHKRLIAWLDEYLYLIVGFVAGVLVLGIVLGTGLYIQLQQLP
jgi:hypothetical protein